MVQFINPDRRCHRPVYVRTAIASVIISNLRINYVIPVFVYIRWPTEVCQAEMYAAVGRLQGDFCGLNVLPGPVRLYIENIGQIIAPESCPENGQQAFPTDVAGFSAQSWLYRCGWQLLSGRSENAARH